MEEVKKGSYFLLSKNIKKKIQDIADRENMSKSAAVAKAIEYYCRDQEQEHAIFLQSLSELLDEKLNPISEHLKKIRVTGNVIDRDTKILLEFMNHYYLVNNFNKLITTEEFKTDGLMQAEDLVKSRIAKNRQRKIDSESSKNNNQ